MVNVVLTAVDALSILYAQAVALACSRFLEAVFWIDFNWPAASELEGAIHQDSEMLG